MSINNPFDRCGNTQMVDRMIGEAYHNVKLVAEQLPDINTLVGALDGRDFAGVITDVESAEATAILARDQAVAASTKLVLTGSTGLNIVGGTNPDSALSVYSEYMEILLKLPGDFVLLVPGPIPTIKVDNGPVREVYNSINDYIDVSHFKAGAWLRLRAVNAFGGLWQLLESQVTKQIVPMYTITDASSSNAIETQGDNYGWSRDKIYVLSLTGDVTVPIPTLARDGLPPLGIYDSSANLLPEGFLRLGRNYFLLYSSSFGGVLKVIGAEQPRGIANYNRGIVAAHEAKAAIRQIYRTIFPVATSFQAPFYENLFTDQSKCNEVEIVHGSVNDQITPTYNKLIHDAAGHGIMDCDINGGLWSDGNHKWPGPGHLNLLGVFKTTTVGGTIPAITDARNIRVTMEIKANNLDIPDDAVLGLHMQMLDSASGGLNKAINYFYTERTMHEALGFSYSNCGGLGWPHLRTAPRTSGWVTFTADLAPNDAFFDCIGSSEGRIGTYGVAPVERALRGLFYDFIIVALHPNQDSPTSMPVKRLSGQLLIRKFSLQRPA